MKRNLPSRAFQSELQIGRKYEKLVQQFLGAHGIEAVEGPHRGADLVLASGKTVEVKSRRKAFSGLHDFTESEFTVDRAECWDAKKPKPLVYVIVSQVTGEMLWTPGNSRRNWKVRLKPNNRGGLAPCYVCSKRHLRPMSELVELLLK